jgi:hypothetical protein
MSVDVPNLKPQALSVIDQVLRALRVQSNNRTLRASPAHAAIENPPHDVEAHRLPSPVPITLSSQWLNSKYATKIRDGHKSRPSTFKGRRTITGHPSDFTDYPDGVVLVRWFRSPRT